MTNTTKYDRRRKYYLVFDCETATLPCAMNYDGEVRKSIAIAKPLIYDLGWQVIDRHGRVYARKKFLVSEIFSVPAIFNTAYYASKRPIYLEMLRNGEITLTDWATATAELVADMEACEAVGAYNSMFDYKKALPFTELYISKLYSEDFYEWEAFQNERCEHIARHASRGSNREFEPDIFRFRGREYPLFDLWGMSCEYLLNNDDYKQMCLDYGWVTESGKYFKTSAETAYRFLTNNVEFDEAHTAFDDAEIESEIFAAIVGKSIKNLTMGITYFPFRILGRVENF